jgi:glycosyltransferase involved in cell wall biosynthesis
MISIITPSLNGGNFIRQNIESIAQLKIPYEHIIVDGGSTDSSCDIVKQYAKVRLMEQKEETGMYGAIDMGFNSAKGQYICWVNCDDRIIPDGFEQMYYYAQKHQLDFVCSNGIFEYLDGMRKIVRGTRFAKYFLKKSYFPHVQPSTIFRKTLYFAVNGFDYRSFKISGDGDLYTRMAMEKDARFGYIDIESSEFKVLPTSLGNTNTEKWYEEVGKKVYLNRSNAFDTVLLKLCRILHV